MKLVDILARYMARWPEGMIETVGQGEEGYLHGYAGNGHPNCQTTRATYPLCDDYENEKVTRAQWQAAVDALKADDTKTKGPESYALRDQAIRSLRYVEQTGQLIWKDNRQIRFNGREAGWVNRHGYRRVRILKTKIDAHRLVWLMHYGALPEGEVDHINGNKLDNRLENLRLANQQRNQQNVGVRADNRLGVKGVRIRPSGKYQARVKLTDGSKLVKSFACLDDAVAWLSSARKESHGEFARDAAEHISAEKEISGMIDDAMDGHMCLTEAEAKIVCTQLHKAGYRKQESGK